MKMKLGWWRDREGKEREVDIDHGSGEWRFESSVSERCWRIDGSWDLRGIQSPNDLIEFLRPLESEIPPALNSAVKAAEDMVRRLERHHAALRNQANEAWEILAQAKRELERLEKECEVGK